MAIVYTRTFGNAVVHIDDDVIKSQTPEEKRLVREELNAELSRALSNPETCARLKEMYRQGITWANRC